MTQQEIFEKVKVQIAHAQNKHGKWTDLSVEKQLEAIMEERKEIDDAIFLGDVHGEHGEIAETIQLMAVMCRRIMYLTGEDQ